MQESYGFKHVWNTVFNTKRRIYPSNPGKTKAKTDLSASLLGHYNYENVTIDDNDFDVLDVSGQGNNLRFGGAGTSYTSASIITGVDGKENSAIEWSGSLAGASGNMFLLSQPDGGVTDINNNLHTLSSSFTGFTMATWFKTEDSSSNIIMSIDIKSSGSIVKTTQTSSNGALGTHDEADGWWLGHTNNRILGEVTDAGFPILNNANFRSAATLDVDDGEWHHVALSYNKTTGTGSLYYDGANVKTLSGILMTGSNAMDSLGISAGPGGAIGYGDGAWDESRFYNKPLSHEHDGIKLHTTRKDWSVYTNSWSDPNVANTLKGAILKKEEYYSNPEEFFGSIILHLRQSNFDIPLDYSLISEYISGISLKRDIETINLSNREKKAIRRYVEKVSNHFGYEL